MGLMQSPTADNNPIPPRYPNPAAAERVNRRSGPHPAHHDPATAAGSAGQARGPTAGRAGAAGADPPADQPHHRKPWPPCLAPANRRSTGSFTTWARFWPAHRAPNPATTTGRRSSTPPSSRHTTRRSPRHPTTTGAASTRKSSSVPATAPSSLSATGGQATTTTSSSPTTPLRTCHRQPGGARRWRLPRHQNDHHTTPDRSGHTIRDHH